MNGQGFFRGNIKAILGLTALVALVPLVIIGGTQAVRLFTQAAPIRANITVDVGASQGRLSRPWAGLSQGGEQETPGVLVSLAPVSSQIRAINTKYIRIDHVLEEPFTYKERIREIIDAGATPIIALSYFPRGVADSDIGMPRDWALWQSKVKALVEDVSGRSVGQMNLAGVYYEVWNEPDGPTFGDFTIGSGSRKDYFELYAKTVAAIESAQNVNSFKIAGPSLADLRRCSNGALFICQKYWLDAFLELVAKNGVRIDAITWHKYATKISDYHEDVNFILKIATKYPQLPRTEKIITEFGSKPERSPIHNTSFDAAHLVAAAAAFVGHVDIATKFEVRDGPDSLDQGWGILYHDGKTKPTYDAFVLLGKLRSDRITLSGEGTFVTGLASKDSRGVTIILANYDSASRNLEAVPLTINRLPNGIYALRKYTISGRPNCPLTKPCETEVTISTGSYKNHIANKPPQEILPPNSVILYDFSLKSRL